MTTIPSSSTSPTPGTRTLRFPEITALARFAPASAISFVFVHCGAVVSRQPAATSLSPPTPATTRQLEDLTAAGCLSSSGRIHYLDFDSNCSRLRSQPVSLHHPTAHQQPSLIAAWSSPQPNLPLSHLRGKENKTSTSHSARNAPSLTTPQLPTTC